MANRWRIIDERTGHYVTSGAWQSEESAWRQITQWQERAERGGRPDNTDRDLVWSLKPIEEEV